MFRYKSMEELQAKLGELGVRLPAADDAEVLREPLDVAGLQLQNRMVVQPMEGCDGNPASRRSCGTTGSLPAARRSSGTRPPPSVRTAGETPGSCASGRTTGRPSPATPTGSAGPR